MRMTRKAAYYFLAVGLLNLALWSTLLATGQVTDLAERSVAYTFHLTAEFSMSVLLIVAGVTYMKHRAYARRLLYFAAGMLLIAALGMIVVYVSKAFLPFVALGAIISLLTVAFLAQSYSSTPDLVYLALGTVLYVELNALGNLLQSGDDITAAYVTIALAVTLPVTILVFRRPL
jgi:hypothetical protein